MTALLPKNFLSDDRHLISPTDPSAVEQFTASIWKSILSLGVVNLMNMLCKAFGAHTLDVGVCY